MLRLCARKLIALLGGSFRWMPSEYAGRIWDPLLDALNCCSELTSDLLSDPSSTCAQYPLLSTFVTELSSMIVSMLSILMRLKSRLRTQGFVHGVLLNGHGTALDAFVHWNGCMISWTNRCDPAKPHDSAEKRVYTMCFGSDDNSGTLLSVSAMAKTATVPETSLSTPSVRSWNRERLSRLLATTMTGFPSSADISTDGVENTEMPPTASHHPGEWQSVLERKYNPSNIHQTSSQACLRIHGCPHERFKPCAVKRVIRVTRIFIKGHALATTGLVPGFNMLRVCMRLTVIIWL